MPDNTKTKVKQTSIWFIAPPPPFKTIPVRRFRDDTHRVTFHNDYIAVGEIDKYGDEKSRAWFPWHTIRRVEETWL